MLREYMLVVRTLKVRIWALSSKLRDACGTCMELAACVICGYSDTQHISSKAAKAHIIDLTWTGCSCATPSHMCAIDSTTQCHQQLHGETVKQGISQPAAAISIELGADTAHSSRTAQMNHRVANQS